MPVPARGSFPLRVGQPRLTASCLYSKSTSLLCSIFFLWIFSCAFFAHVGLAQRSPLPSFCDNDACSIPTALYTGNASELNYEPFANIIPRNTPDGIHPWPYECTDTNCTIFNYKIFPPATWWSQYTSLQALPTNTWWTPYFCDPPGSINPAGWVWPVYQLPYTTLALQSGFGVGYAAAQQFPGQPGASDIGSVLPPTILLNLIAQSFQFTAYEGMQYGQEIVTFDQYGLGVQLRYTAISGGTLDVFPVKGHPYMTFVFQGAITPTILTETGFIYLVNNIQCNVTSEGGVVVPPEPLSNGIFVYDILTYGSGPQQRWRLFTTTSAPITVYRGGGSSPFSTFYIQAATQCLTTCVYRLICYENDFLDPVYPIGWFTSLAEEGGKMSVDVSTADQYANVYPVVASVADSVNSLDFDYTTTVDDLTISFTWPVACMTGVLSPGTACDSDQLLMLALPHHQDLTQPSAPQQPVTSIQIPTIQGIGVGFAGNNWIHTYNLTQLLGYVASGGADPFYANPPLSKANPAAVPIVEAQVEADLLYWTTNYYANVTYVYSDCYLFGKVTASIARLALIADEIGNEELAAECRQAVKTRLNEWLDPTVNSWEYPFHSSQRLIYDTVWGGIMPLDGLQNPGASWDNSTEELEFGSGGYNDHLFHYGYYLYSVAAVLHSQQESDVAWFAKLRLRILAMARDIANPDPVSDPYFTMLRHKSDWYSGHSWATGLFPSALYPDLESTSEGVNAWYSLILLGTAMQENGDSLGANLFQVGRILAATDIHSIRFYVQSWSDWSAPNFPPLRTQIYPENFASLGVVGNIWGGEVQYDTFFSYGQCEWLSEPNYLNPGPCEGRHLLTYNQILYSNQLFIYLIQFLPFTPITPWLNQRDWLEQSFNTQALVFQGGPNNATSYGYNPIGKADTFPDMFNQCNTLPQNTTCDSWMAYSWQVLSMLGSTNQQTAWQEIQTYTRTLWGNTISNSLWFIATQV